MEDKKRIGKNFFWNTLGSGFASVISLLYLIIVTRINGLEQAGIFTVLFTTSNILYCVGLYCGRTFQVTDTNDKFSDSDYVGHRFSTSVIMLIIMLIISLVNKYDNAKFYIFLFLTLSKLIESISDVFYGILQKNERLDLVGKALLFRSILNIGLFVFIDLLTKNIVYSCIGVVISNLFILLFIDIKFSKKYLIDLNMNNRNIVLLYKVGFSIFCITVINNYMFNIPRYILDSYHAQYSGIYGIIIMPATIVLLLNQFILQPLIVTLKEYYNNKDKNNFIKCINRIVIFSLFIGLVLIVAFSFCGIPLFNILYGIDLSQYLGYLLIIILSSTFYTVSSIFLNALIIYRKNNVQLIIYICTTILSLIISYLLVPNYELFGAVISYMLTMIILLIFYASIYVYITNKKIEWSDKNA